MGPILLGEASKGQTGYSGVAPQKWRTENKICRLGYSADSRARDNERPGVGRTKHVAVIFDWLDSSGSQLLRALRPDLLGLSPNTSTPDRYRSGSVRDHRCLRRGGQQR